MGIYLSTFVKNITRIFSSDGNSCSILIVGLANAGKTSLVQILKAGLDETVQEILTEPTIGHSVETIKYKHVSMHIWDLGGQDKIQLLWPNYYLTAQAVIFMVDSSDPDRFSDAKIALESLLTSEDLTLSAPVLILANKQDLLKVGKQDDIIKYFDISEITERPIKLFPCTVKSRIGVEEAMGWLLESLKMTSS